LGLGGMANRKYMLTVLGYAEGEEFRGKLGILSRTKNQSRSKHEIYSGKSETIREQKISREVTEETRTDLFAEKEPTAVRIWT